MITIFKGDDTGGIFGRRVLLTIESDVSLAGCSCDFVLHGITKHIDAPITPGETYELVYTHEETDTMPLGVSRARVVIIDASGRRSTVSNTHRVLVTDVVADILPESSVSVSLHALRIDDIEGLGDALDGKQKKLTAGQNITIADDGTISASGVVGGGAVTESQQNPGYAANADFAQAATFAETSSRAEFAYSDENGVNINENYAKKAELIVRLDLVGDGSAASPYTIQLAGEVQTFDQIKTFAETRNAVIQRGQGTYRVTYIGATEMMWDVTGTVQGDVLTGQIHIFDQDGVAVVQRVAPKTLATKPMIDEIKDTVSTDNRFLVNGTTAAIQTRTDETAEWTDEIRVDKGYDALQGDAMVKLDKSVQTVTVSGGTLTVELPDAVDGTVRDLCLYINNTSPTETVTMTFPAGVTVYKSKGGDDPKAAAQAGGITAYYFTEIPGGAWRVMRDELEVAT